MDETIKKQFRLILTLNNAREWFRKNEKWLFVTGLIRDEGFHYNPHGGTIDQWVRVIEREFDRILIEAGE